MKNRIIIIGLIFSIVFQTFGLQPNDFISKNTDKATFHADKKAENSLFIKTLFIEEETKESSDDDFEPNQKYLNLSSLSLYFSNIFLLSELQNFTKESLNSTFSYRIYLIFRNIRI